MADGLLPRCPLYSDIRQFSGSEFHAAGITAGFPCQARLTTGLDSVTIVFHAFFSEDDFACREFASLEVAVA